MINDVDESLRALIRRDVLNGANVDIAFEAPSKDWSARRNAPAINLYLYEIREDLQRREEQYEDIRDERGFVVERRLPPRRFKLSYLLTAWTQRPDDEHRLLSSALSCFLQFDALPPELLQGELAHQRYPVRITVGLPLPPERSISDVWTALGGELKPSLDVVVTVPFQTRRQLHPVGPPVLEEPRISIAAGAEGKPVTPPGKADVGAPQPPGSGKRRGKRPQSASGEPAPGDDQPGGNAGSEPGEGPAADDQTGAGDREGGQPAAGEDPARRRVAEAVASEVRLGGRGPEGRTLRIRTLPRR
ncbi:MAG TPA: Pvc16 family protein [Actinomycetota bacterium]